MFSKVSRSKLNCKFGRYKQNDDIILEAIRVNTFVEVAKQQSPEAVHLMKQLMRQSHESLKTLYECSHPNLDKLVQISDSLNVGARLTGAG